MLISAILLTSGIFNSIFDQVIQLYVDRSIAREMSGEGTQNMSTGELLMTLALIKPLLYECVCLLGGFLVYREWRQGKFRHPPLNIEKTQIIAKSIKAFSKEKVAFLQWYTNVMIPRFLQSRLVFLFMEKEAVF